MPDSLKKVENQLTKRLAVNWTLTVSAISWRKRELCSSNAERFNRREFAAECFVQPTRTQKQKCRAFRELSNGRI